LFDYITRYKPQKIDLDSKIKPFVPEFIPCVGEVDSFLKMTKPDGTKEDLGIMMVDEPSLNHEDKTVLEMKYI
jgi:intraflagellar transport protein 46